MTEDGTKLSSSVPRYIDSDEASFPDRLRNLRASTANSASSKPAPANCNMGWGWGN